MRSLLTSICTVTLVATLSAPPRRAPLAAPPGAPSGEQGFNGNPIADSATVARLAWGRAVAAMQANDLAAARAEVECAARAWPTQMVYAWGRVALAAQAADTSGLVAALGAYADLGLGRDLAREPALVWLAALPTFKSLAERHNANRSTIARGVVRATIDDSTFWPEGVDYDAKRGVYYVASVRHGTIAEVWPATSGSPVRVRELMPRHAPGIGAILGVRADTARGVIWATTTGIPQMEGYQAADSSIAALLRIRIVDGVIERRWDLPPSPNGHVPGDLAVGPRGDVFVTDSRDPVLYRLAPGADTLATMRHPLFHSLQGMAPTPDGRFVYVSDYSHGILRVALATGTVMRVADAPHSTSLGCDGIVWDRGAVIAVQNGVTPARVMRFVLNADGTGFVRADVLDRNPDVADEPTIGTIAGRTFVYVANSQWDKHDDAGVPRKDARLTRPLLLAVPLPR